MMPRSESISEIMDCRDVCFGGVIATYDDLLNCFNGVLDVNECALRLAPIHQLQGLALHQALQFLPSDQVDNLHTNHNFDRK